MRKEVQDFYVEEIFRQSEFAMLASAEIGHCINKLTDCNGYNGGLAPPEVKIIFQHIHSFLTHASNISKLFWPTALNQGKKETPEAYNLRCPGPRRGDYLRRLYSINSGNPLENRGLRNHLEHFDERLDEFVAEWSKYSGQAASRADINVGDVRMVLAYVQPKFIMRHFDYSTNKFIFRGKEYELFLLKKAIDSVHARSVFLLPTLLNFNLFNLT